MIHQPEFHMRCRSNTKQTTTERMNWMKSRALKKNAEMKITTQLPFLTSFTRKINTTTDTTTTKAESAEFVKFSILLNRGILTDFSLWEATVDKRMRSFGLLLPEVKQKSFVCFYFVFTSCNTRVLPWNEWHLETNKSKPCLTGCHTHTPNRI